MIPKESDIVTWKMLDEFMEGFDAGNERVNKEVIYNVIELFFRSCKEHMLEFDNILMPHLGMFKPRYVYYWRKKCCRMEEGEHKEKMRQKAIEEIMEHKRYPKKRKALLKYGLLKEENEYDVIRKKYYPE